MKILMTILLLSSCTQRVIAQEKQHEKSLFKQVFLLHADGGTMSNSLFERWGNVSLLVYGDTAFCDTVLVYVKARGFNSGKPADSSFLENVSSVALKGNVQIRKRDGTTLSTDRLEVLQPE